MRYRIRVRIIRYLDMASHASSVHKAHRLAIKASESVPSSQWEVYKAILWLDGRPEKYVELKIVRKSPQAQGVSDDCEVAEKKQHEVRVEECRWCDIVIEAPTKKAALRRAANMDVAAIVPPSEWDGYTSAKSEEDGLVTGDWGAE